MHVSNRGNLTAATNVDVIESKKINHILTIDSCPLPRKITELNNLKTMFIQVTDTPREDLLSHFEETYHFIQEGVKNGTVLVHCYFGVSRSATIIIAYLMKKHRMSVQEAFELAKSKRRFIGPNPGFMAQLQLFEVMDFTIDKSNLQYKMFRLYIAADRIVKTKILPQCCADVVKPDPSVTTVQPDPRVYRCKKCRKIVATASNIIPHISKQKYSWRDKRYSEEIDAKDFCDKIYFVEPLAWMQTVSIQLEGKLYCPNVNCKHKLGSYSWTMGCLCPCGTKVSPAFYLVPSKVDKGNFVQNVQVTV
ncbi:UNVERIFIED_CONTAM: hypothetical protein PYX00_003670 [Menopon gallinae]|uniref:Protein-tyrosine-phosphatase n=1 Tax=Menopon gallinae TaxID=328185 RepID=A0AAW2I2I5_9NEOP